MALAATLYWWSLIALLTVMLAGEHADQEDPDGP
jgi:hypothetical protein